MSSHKPLTHHFALSLLAIGAYASLALAVHLRQLNFQPNHSNLVWLLDICVLTGGALLLCLGLVDLRRSGINLKTASIPLLGLFLFAQVGVSSFLARRFFEDATELNRGFDLKQVNAAAAKVLSDPGSSQAKRIRASEIRARIVFSETGEIMPVVNESGAESPFQPTDADHAAWRTRQQLRLILPWAIGNARRGLHVSGLVALAALALGLLIPIRR